MQERPKIGILCTMINAFGRKGFYNSQEIGLGRALEKKGYDVTIYKGVEKGSGFEINNINEHLKIMYIPLKKLGAHGWFNPEMIEKGTEGILCFSDNQQFIPHIYKYCKKEGIVFVPYVGTAHSLHSGFHAKVMDSAFHMGTKKKKKKIPVLVKTESAALELNNLGITSTILAPVGLDMDSMHSTFRDEDRDAIREELGYSPEDVVILNVARMDPEKRPLDLIDIFDDIKNKKQFKLMIVGEGDLSVEVRRRVRYLDLQSRVNLISRITYDQMWKAYVAADYFVNLNKGEIFGMAIMEAVYYETSVAASMALGPKLTLKDKPGHKLRNNDTEMKKWLISKYPSYEDLHESSLKAIKDYSWDRCADAFLNVVHAMKEGV